VSQPGSLGERLKRLRTAAGLTQQGMAADLGWVASKISKIERGDQMPTAEDIRAWTAQCRQPEATEEFLDLLADAQTIRDDARRRAGRGQASRQVSMDDRAKAAKRIRDAEPMAIPGMLQTAAYARAIAEQVALVYGAGDIDTAVEARLRRGEILYDRTKEFQFIMTEAALRMPPCPVQVMLGQLTKLLTLLDLDNVTLGIIPLGVELSFAPYFGFLVLDDTVIVEDYLGSNVVSGEGVTVFNRIFDLLMSEAVRGDEARKLITAAAASLIKASQRPSTAGDLYPGVGLTAGSRADLAACRESPDGLEQGDHAVPLGREPAVGQNLSVLGLRLPLSPRGKPAQVPRCRAVPCNRSRWRAATR
jgi:transcriptional regulator with XRE-family HTH domain